jgi:hypothetical protein
MAFQPFIMGTSVLTIAATAYQVEVSSAVFTPSSSTITWTSIAGATHSFAPPATWVLDLQLAQDWAEASSLSRYLHDNEGDIVAAVLTPVGGGPTATANITLTPGAIGGDTTAVAGATVSLGSTKPVLSAGT